MYLLGRLRLHTKLFLLLALSVSAVVSMLWVSASVMHQRMVDDRIDKVRALALTVRGIAGFLDGEVRAGRLTRDQATREMTDMVHSLRYGSADDYFLAQTADGIVIMHGGAPNREGKPTTAKDDQGRSSAELARTALGERDGGVIWYGVAKPGQPTNLPKVSYVARFAPWGLDFITGSWVDDIETAYHATLRRLLTIGGSILVCSLLAAWVVNRDIKGSLDGLKRAMERLSGGDADVTIPGTDRKDEVGAMAAAVQVFKENAREVERLTAHQRVAEEAAARDKASAMRQVAETFESDVGEIVSIVAAAATELQATASALQATAESTSGQAAIVASASAHASTNVQGAANAAEELTASVREIARQVLSSSDMASRATEEAARSSTLINGLADSARQLSAITEMITEIAGKTNLLALNATIEAARAGDAGKGFAVVAAEVKSLANQTSKATEAIGARIAAIQNTTADTVAAIQSIAVTIRDLNRIAITISTAVEQQGAATQEIAHNVQRAAAGSMDVSTGLDSVTRSVGDTGAAATQVLQAAGDLSRQAETLKFQVSGFLGTVRMAA